MANILVACNNGPGTDLHNFMQSCADEARQICVDNTHNYTLVEVPQLTEHNVISAMPNHQICVIAAHGDADGVYNENDTDVVTTHTTNYIFANKGFYSISCSCAQNLCPELIRIGLSIFVGYDAPFYVGDSENAFLDCAIEGLSQLLKGQTKSVAHKAMLDKFDAVIKTLSFKDQLLLLHNKEHLIFAGEDCISLNCLA